MEKGTLFRDAAAGVPTERTPKRPAEPLLEVRDLAVRVAFRRGAARPVDGVSFSLLPGQTLALVGESGSGKTMTALAVMGLLPRPAASVAAGSIRFEGRDIHALPEHQYRRLRGSRMSMIFQDPMSSLNPVHTVGHQIAEMFVRHGRLGRRRAYDAAVALMERMRIPDARRRAAQYPHQFSGGMRQRIMIAMAVALEPALLIADEPTTALDVTVQAQILSLLRDLQRRESTATLFISHDLGVVASVASHVVVMYAGRVVESGPVRQVYDAPAHPYTRSLLRSAPALDRGGGPLEVIGGSPPTVDAVPDGCPFHPRCAFARENCRTDAPEIRVVGAPPVGADHTAACHHLEDVAADWDLVPRARVAVSSDDG